MPDCHSAAYCLVGFTSVIKDKIVPQIVGGDMSCGISCYNTNKVIKEKQYKKIDDMIKSIIPMGPKIHLKSIQTPEIMQNMYKECNDKLEKLKIKFPDYPFNNFQYCDNYYQSLIKKLHSKTNSSLFMRALGTLGGGNHYIEFDINESGKSYITCHSGSRIIGQEICSYHQHKAKELAKKRNPKENKHDLLNCYLDGNELVEYLIDAIFADRFASFNRRLMIKQICEEIGVKYDDEKLIETIHNYIDIDRMILRKGAISAEAGEKCIISLNMRDGILLCKGKGNTDWNYSSAHGAGRLMSRSDAKASFHMSQFKKEMSEVYSSSINKDTLDECPMAYKDAEMIKKYIGDSVDIISQLKPIINVKGW
tara:strand:+ start:68 stop:1165 length:1098 start_codon:yes stop_codon:yes gene_type:complete